MSTIRRIIFVMGSLQLVGFIGSGAHAAPATQPAGEESGINALLDRKLPEVKFDGVAFADVLDFLRDVSGAKIDVDWEALKSAGIAKETPVSSRLFNVKTSKAVQLILDSVSTKAAKLHSEVDVKNNRLVITTYDDYVTHNTEDREYDVRDMINVATPKAQAQHLYDDISKLIRETVAADSWVADGGKPGVIQMKDGRMTITQTRENHRQIENLMAQLRETHTHKTTQQSNQAPRLGVPVTRPVR